MEKSLDDCVRSYAILLDYNDVLDMNLTEIEQKVCPALVDAVGHVLGRDHKSLPVLADVVMCIYLSDRAQSKFHEFDSESRKPGRQYAVLVGDYWLSESFRQLISHEMYVHISLRHITNLVRTMKKGALLRWKLAQKQVNHDKMPLIWELERGALMALCGKLTAEILNADAEIVRLFENFGRCLGLAWAAGIESEDCGTHTPESFLLEADKWVNELTLHYDVTALIKLREFIAGQILS
jgi:hypothetical protein